MKQYAIRVLTIVFILLGLGLALLTMMQVWQVKAGGNLPNVSYLGNSGTFNVGPEHNFIVKQLRPFRFVSVPGPEYTAQADERVWSVQGNVEVPAADVGSTRILGPVEAGCIIDYVTIDDDIDDRVNYFLLDEEIIYVMGQGLTTRGRFMVERNGILSYRADDSIGTFVNVCEESVTLTPPPTLTPTATSIPTETPSITATPTATVPGILTATPTSEPVVLTPTAEPDIATETPTPLPTPTSEPRLASCLRINFDVSGDEARRGLYIAQEVGGRFLAGWEADDGWKDSGWFYDIDITFPAVYTEVLYYSGPGVEPVYMKIVNPAPDTEHGWLARGMCHALEVGWP